MSAICLQGSYIIVHRHGINFFGLELLQPFKMRNLLRSPFRAKALLGLINCICFCQQYIKLQVGVERLCAYRLLVTTLYLEASLLARKKFE